MHQPLPPPQHPPPFGLAAHASAATRAASPHRIGAGAEGCGGASGLVSAGFQAVETDMTVQAFSQWLTEMKARNSRTQQEMLSEMSIIRDGIASNNMDLTDLKRHSMG